MCVAYALVLCSGHSFLQWSHLQKFSLLVVGGVSSQLDGAHFNKGHAVCLQNETCQPCCQNLGPTWGMNK